VMCRSFQMRRGARPVIPGCPPSVGEARNAESSGHVGSRTANDINGGAGGGVGAPASSPWRTCERLCVELDSGSSAI
jgi:hypothetical protein